MCPECGESRYWSPDGGCLICARSKDKSKELAALRKERDELARDHKALVKSYAKRASHCVNLTEELGLATKRVKELEKEREKKNYLIKIIDDLAKAFQDVEPNCASIASWIKEECNVP